MFIIGENEFYTLAKASGYCFLELKIVYIGLSSKNWISTRIYQTSVKSLSCLRF